MQKYDRFSLLVNVFRVIFYTRHGETTTALLACIRLITAVGPLVPVVAGTIRKSSAAFVARVHFFLSVSSKVSP